MHCRASSSIDHHHRSPPFFSSAPMHTVAPSHLHFPAAAPLRRHGPPTSTHLANLGRVLSANPTPARLPPLSTSPPPGTVLVGNHAKQEEAISPRRLRHLRQLLSDQPEDASPRRSIAHRWRTLHGASHWASLLDPLDHDLRSELLRYGDHVQSTYIAFHSEVPNVTLPDPAYRLTRHLHGTSSIALPPWFRDAAPAWLTQRSSWLGYVAVCDRDDEIRRLGRRDIVIALRGTATCLEWAENFRNLLVDLPADRPTSVPVKVQLGFRSLFTTPAPGGRSLADAVTDEIRRLVELYRGEELSITVTGHSLGAALALLVADELAASVLDAPPATVLSFGGPRVGNRGFAERLARKGVRVLRVINERDMVTRVPGVLVSEAVDTWLDGEGGPAHEAVATWGYWHVGRELRVDSRASPFLREDAGPACCHDLEAYLHLVDGFMASRRPFREDARRSIVRLMSLQAGSVKKLYTREAAAMGVRVDY